MPGGGRSVGGRQVADERRGNLRRSPDNQHRLSIRHWMAPCQITNINKVICSKW
jgi:hypothetical protein